MAVVALEEALAVIYHYKSDLRRFLQIAVDNRALVDRWPWDDSSVYKRQIVRDLVGHLCADQDRHLPALTRLCFATIDFTSFEHLARLDDGARRVSEAKAAVAKLRSLVEPHKNSSDRRTEEQERQRRDDERRKQNAAVRERLEGLRSEFFELAASEDAQKRGFQLERILRGAFDLFDLDPKASFKIVGEQIDGAFVFDGTDFLLEARWTKAPQDAAALYGFTGKVSRKLDNTLGLFISINGYSAEALQAFSVGDRPKILLMDGADLAAVLDQRITLDALLLRKRQHAARTGQVFLSAHALLSA